MDLRPPPLRRRLPFSREFPFRPFVIAQMRTHEALPQFAVVRHREVEQLMNDDVIADIPVEMQKLSVEVQIPAGGTGCPFVAHWAKGEPPPCHSPESRSFSFVNVAR